MKYYFQMKYINKYLQYYIYNIKIQEFLTKGKGLFK